MKFNLGDYILYTPEQEKQVIDSLLGFGQAVCSKKLEGNVFNCFVFSGGEWFRMSGFNGIQCKKDITSEFVYNIRKNKKNRPRISS